MDYKEAAELAQSGRTRIGGGKARRIGNNTFAVGRGDHVAIRLHETDILRLYPDGAVTLDSGGWRTVTTKARFNEYLPSGWYVSQSDGQWFLSRYAGTQTARSWDYAEGITITADGEVEYRGDKPLVGESFRKLRGRVKRYVDGYMSALDSGKVPAPGPGDCFYCGMSVADGPDKGRGLGEVTRDKDHILSHLSERYYVPSLIARAAEAFGVSQAARWYLTGKWTGDNRCDAWGGIAQRQLRSALRRYILRQLGQAA